MRRAGGDFALARYSSNSALDTAFGTNGRATTDFGGRYEAAVVELAAGVLGGGA